MSKLNIVRGLKFKSKNFSMDAEVIQVKREPDDNILVVKLTPPEGESWEEDWNLKHTRWGFESGEYYVVFSPENVVGFTPGVWEVRGNKVFSGEGYNSICTVHIQSAWDSQSNPIEDHEAKANAQLIAGAPYLYIALNKLREAIQEGDPQTISDILLSMGIPALQKANPHFKL